MRKEASPDISNQVGAMIKLDPRELAELNLLTEALLATLGEDFTWTRAGFTGSRQRRATD